MVRTRASARLAEGAEEAPPPPAGSFSTLDYCSDSDSGSGVDDDAAYRPNKRRRRARPETRPKPKRRPRPVPARRKRKPEQPQTSGGTPSAETKPPETAAAVPPQLIFAPYTAYSRFLESYPLHPDVKFKRLPFYEPLATLIKPSTVDAFALDGRPQDFRFDLTPHEVHTYASEPDTVSVQLRFCLLETSCEQDDCFPPNLVVKVNGRHCPLPMPAPTNKILVEPKRPPGPVNVTSLTRISPMLSNVVSVSWRSDFGRRYAFCATLVRKLTSAQLLARLKSKGTKHPDYTRSLIKEKLRPDDHDCEIATTSLRVSLACPLGKTRMACPCRPTACSHLQCFDASLFLQMNERKPTWVCPVCDGPAAYDGLVVDGYFREVLESPRLAPDASEIQLHPDGSWSAQSGDAPADPRLASDGEVEILDDDSGDRGRARAESDSLSDVVPLSDGGDSPAHVPRRRRPHHDEVIDLSSDGDDPSPVPASETPPTVIALDSPSPPDVSEAPVAIESPPPTEDAPGVAEGVAEEVVVEPSPAPSPVPPAQTSVIVGPPIEAVTVKEVEAEAPTETPEDGGSDERIEETAV